MRDREGAPIRMVDLATQRAGLPREATNLKPKDPKNPYSDYTEQDLLDFIKNFTPTQARNARYEYSNIGFGLLGYALVRAAKASSFEALLNSRILQPLSMTSTSSDAKKFVELLAQPHGTNGRPTPAFDLLVAYAGAGAIRSTAGDMGRYVEAIAGLKPSPLSDAIGLATTIREDGYDRINLIGLAWMRRPFYTREIMHHNGATGGSSSSLIVDRTAKEGVFIVANASTNLTDIALNLMDARHILVPRELPKVVAVTADVLARYVGNYKLNEQLNVSVRVNGDRITTQVTGQPEIEIYPESETRYFARVAPMAITFGDVIEGKASSFVIEQGGPKITARRIR